MSETTIIVSHVVTCTRCGREFVVTEMLAWPLEPPVPWTACPACEEVETPQARLSASL